MVSSMVVVVGSCKHMVVEETCNLPWEMENSMVVVVSSRHKVEEETCTQL